MKIAVDKNQFAGSHGKSNSLKHDQMTECGVELIPAPLPFGDYCLITDEMQKVLSAKNEKVCKRDLIDCIRLSVDTKKNIEEIWGNVNGKQHERFRKELLKPIAHNSRLVILIEHGEGITSIEDVMFYYQPEQIRTKWVTMMHQGKAIKVRKEYTQKPIYGEKLYKSMMTIRDRYNVQFEFCDKADTGRKIIELLGDYNNDNR